MGCTKQPKITVSTTNLQATINISLYAEYGVAVRKGILSEKTSGRAVWEIEAVSGIPQMHKLVFSVGSNNVEPAPHPGGEYSVVVPKGASTFTLNPKTDYEIEIWRDLNSKPARAVFRLAG